MAKRAVSAGMGDEGTGAVVRSAALFLSAVDRSGDEGGEPVALVVEVTVEEEDGGVVNFCEDACGLKGTKAVGFLFADGAAPVLKPVCKFSP